MVTVWLLPTGAVAEDKVVQVFNNSFSPQRVFVEPGETVTWEMVGSFHTITADDGSFDFPGGANQLHEGERVSHTFPDEGVFYYFCNIHGRKGAYPSGMSGAVYVGVPLDQPIGEVRHVPAQYPTIGSALAGVPPGSTVAVAPGSYNEAIHVTSRDVTIQGEGEAATDVVFDGHGTPTPGIAVDGSGVTLRHLSVRGYTGDGVLVGTGSTQRGYVMDLVIQDVDVDGATVGLNIVAGSSAVSDSHVTRASGAGIAIRGCGPCGAVLERNRVEDSGVGILIASANGVAVRSSELHRNGTGVSLADSQAIDVTDLSVIGGTTAVAVSASTLPSVNVHVFRNVVSGYTGPALSWDLVGARVCFSGNVDSATAAGPSSSPPLLQTLSPCSGVT
jgi:plastocyanin